MPVERIASPDSFMQCIHKNKDVLCLYYWKKCGHCQDFRPIWNDVINHYKHNINIMEVELETIRKLDSKYRINAFPTIVVYRGGQKHAEFTKQRTEKELHNFIHTHFMMPIGGRVSKPAKSTRVKKT